MARDWLLRTGQQENVSKVVQSRSEENPVAESAEAGPVCGRSSQSGWSFAAWHARLSLSLTSRFHNSSRRFMWIGFSRLLIMIAHVLDTPGKGRTRRTTRGSR